MATKHFKCTLLSDVVINAQTATEGQQQSLDYIPGAAFLGIVAAKLYNELKDKAYNVFHSGTVQFGDAHVINNGTICYKIPAAWSYKKGEKLEDGVYTHHLLDKKQLDDFAKQGNQLKQARHGYFNPENNTLVSLDKIFSQKSAHNSKERRSAEGKMFGYESIPQGTELGFELNYPDGFDIDAIAKALTDNQRLGRSKNAQYGLVNIIEADKPPTGKTVPSEKEIVVYAKTDLCFFDDYGESTVQPSIKQLGISGDKIRWDKSQIRTRSYAPWNGKRCTREADRIVIEKGSVIVVNGKHAGGTALIGNYKAEGLGQIIINPDFLMSANKLIAEGDKTISYLSVIPENKTTDDLVSDFTSKKKAKLIKADLMRIAVTKFKNKHTELYKGISNSQWGNIRNIATAAKSKECLVEKLTDSLEKGVASEEWSKYNRRINLMERIKNNFELNEDFEEANNTPDQNNNTLNNDDMPLLVTLLANQMSKS